MEITSEMLNLQRLEDQILERALYEDANVNDENENDAQKKKEIHETVTLILGGGKDRDIQNLELYKEIKQIINTLPYTQDYTKDALNEWLKIFGRFVYICDSLNLGDDVNKAITNVGQTMKNLSSIMQKAQQNKENRLSINAQTQNQARTVAERLRKILVLKATDEQEANRQKEELKRQFPNASKAIDTEYNKYNPASNGQNKQNNNDGQQ